MFGAMHRTSWTEKATSGKELGEPTKQYITTQVTLPSDIADLLELEEGRATTAHWQETAEITVGYSKDANGNWTQVKKTLPFAVAMFIEGYKLHVNATVRPVGQSNCFGADELEAFFNAIPNPVNREVKKSLWQDGSAKIKKAIKAEIEEFLKAKETSAE